MPTARYSRRAMSPNSSTAAASPTAAKPIGSGQCEKPSDDPDAPAALAVRMPWIRRDGDRNPQPRRRGDLLEAVVPFGMLPRWRRGVDVEVAQMLLNDRLLGPAHNGAVGLDGGRRVEHQACLLLHRHPSQEILDTLIDRDRCISVGGDRSHPHRRACHGRVPAITKSDCAIAHVLVNGPRPDTRRDSVALPDHELRRCDRPPARSPAHKHVR